MKIKSFERLRPLSIMPEDDRWYRISEANEIILHTNEGTLRYIAYKGFLFDGRSGGRLVDWVISNLGSQDLSTCWLVHDIGFYPYTVSFELANDILYQMLLLSGVSRLKAWLVFKSVSLFARKFKAEESSEVVGKYRQNLNQYFFRWDK